MVLSACWTGRWISVKTPVSPSGVSDTKSPNHVELGFKSVAGGDGGGPEPQFPTIPILVRFLVGFNDARSSNTKTGFWIREKRLALGISQLQLAKRIGVHEKTVQAWENGESSPRPYNRQLLEIQLIGLPH